MTMQQMNEYLEKRGFEIERTYLKQQGIYQFMIKRDGNITCGNFKYPVNVEWYTRNELMQKFLDKIIGLHERRHIITDMDTASYYPEPEKFWTKENPHVYIPTARGCGKSQTMADMIKHYICSDIETTENIYKRMVNSMYGSRCGISKPYVDPMEIKDVIFNDPATIVFWADGTKTVVKCQEGDVFDPEKGLAMAIAKKVYGNKHDYYDPFKKWCGRYYKKRANIQPWIDAIDDAVEKLKDCDF